MRWSPGVFYFQKPRVTRPRIRVIWDSGVLRRVSIAENPSKRNVARMLGGHALTFQHQLACLPRFLAFWQLVVPAELLEQSALHLPPLLLQLRLRLRLGVHRTPASRAIGNVEAVLRVDRLQDVRNDLEHLCVGTDRIRCVAISRNLHSVHLRSRVSFRLRAFPDPVRCPTQLHSNGIRLCFATRLGRFGSWTCWGRLVFFCA